MRRGDEPNQIPPAKKSVSINVSSEDIVEEPKKIEFVEQDADKNPEVTQTKIEEISVKPKKSDLPRPAPLISEFKSITPTKSEEPEKQKRTFPKINFKLPKFTNYKTLSTIIGGVFAVIIISLLSYNTFKPQTPKYINGKLASISDEPNLATQEKPGFSLYYPKRSPAGLQVDRGSIKYAKDSFVFNIKENGNSSFSVSEQPVSNNFKFDVFKKKLTSPLEIETNLGTAVLGGLDRGLVTGLKTRDNTLIIVNYVDTTCLGKTEAIFNSLQKIGNFNDL